MHRDTVLCGVSFTSLGNHFLLQWPDRQLVEMSRSADSASIEKRLQEVLAAARNGAAKGGLLLLEPKESAYEHPTIINMVEDALRRKSEARHYAYTAVPHNSKRYRFVALNEIGRLLVER